MIGQIFDSPAFSVGGKFYGNFYKQSAWIKLFDCSDIDNDYGGMRLPYHLE